MESDQKTEVKVEDNMKPLHCMPDQHPSQSINKFESIRFFSNFDSGNLLKVILSHPG